MGTCNIFFFAVVSFPSTSTFTDDSTFVLKTGSSIETWTGITSLEKNDTVEWTWKKKISINKKGLGSSCNQTILPPMKSYHTTQVIWNPSIPHPPPRVASYWRREHIFCTFSTRISKDSSYFSRYKWPNCLITFVVVLVEVSWK